MSKEKLYYVPVVMVVKATDKGHAEGVAEDILTHLRGQPQYDGSFLINGAMPKRASDAWAHLTQRYALCTASWSHFLAPGEALTVTEKSC